MARGAAPDVIALIYLVLSYLLAAVPFGVAVTTLYGGDEDIRSGGSGNIGVTNVARLHGWRVAVPVLLLDVGKGFLPVHLAPWAVPDGGVAWLGLVGATAFLGHCYPIYLGLRGGKGVATGGGAMLAMAPAPTVFAVGVWAALLVLGGRSSVASLGATTALVAVIWFFEPALRAIVVLLAVGVVASHVQNIGRLVRGEEARLVPPVRWGRRAREGDDDAGLLEAGPARADVRPAKWRRDPPADR